MEWKNNSYVSVAVSLQVFLHVSFGYGPSLYKTPSREPMLLFFGVQADTKLDRLFKHGFRLCQQKPRGRLL